MKWVRSKARKLSLLALFVLAVQLGLSFGHVHATGFGPLGDHTALTDTALANTSSPDTPSPDTQHDQDNGNDVCAICATIVMANTLVDAVPPVLPLPAQLYAKPLFVTALLDTAQPQRLSFQSRAPPRS